MKKKQNKGVILFTVIATGIVSVTGQLVILREFLALFSGNEFLIALVLFNWLIAGGLGSLAFLVIDKARPSSGTSPASLGILSLFLCALSPVQLFLLRALRDLFFLYGSSPGFYPIAMFSFLTLLPYAGLVGFALPFSLRAARSENPDFPGALIYITDNLGDMLGGALFSFVLVFLVSPVQAMILAGLPLLAAACLLIRNRLKPLQIGALTLTILTLGAACVLEPSSLAPVTGKLVEYLETRYGRITVIDDQGQLTLFQDGEPVFSSDDPVRAEERVHYAMAQVENPESVLLVSARSGIFPEIAKYRPTTVDYVELDPSLTASLHRAGLIRPIFGLAMIHRDARTYLAHTSKTYDAVLFNLPEPSTFQVNRFYTLECFRMIRDHLNPGGVLAVSVKGFDSYLDHEKQSIISCLYHTASTAFPYILPIPGQDTYLICSDRPLDPDIPALLARKKIDTAYIRDYFNGDVNPRRQEYLRSMILPDTPVNTDTRPRLMSFMFSQWFAQYKTRPLFFVGALALFLLVYLPRLSREEALLFTTGFTVMGSELLVIFSVQVVFGYIYEQIGVLVTVFLAGLLPGAWLAARAGFHRRRKTWLGGADLALVLLLILFALGSLTGMIQTRMVFYLAFGFTLSLICGFQFPLVLASRNDSNSAVGRAFSADLTGAAFGVLVTSVVLVPFCGLIMSACVLAALKLVSLTVLVLPARKQP